MMPLFITDLQLIKKKNGDLLHTCKLIRYFVVCNSQQFHMNTSVLQILNA